MSSDRSARADPKAKPRKPEAAHAKAKLHSSASRPSIHPISGPRPSTSTSAAVASSSRRKSSAAAHTSTRKVATTRARAYTTSGHAPNAQHRHQPPAPTRTHHASSRATRPHHASTSHPRTDAALSTHRESKSKKVPTQHAHQSRPRSATSPPAPQPHSRAVSPRSPQRGLTPLQSPSLAQFPHSPFPSPSPLLEIPAVGEQSLRWPMEFTPTFSQTSLPSRQPSPTTSPPFVLQATLPTEYLASPFESRASSPALSLRPHESTRTSRPTSPISSHDPFMSLPPYSSSSSVNLELPTVSSPARSPEMASGPDLTSTSTTSSSSLRRPSMYRPGFQPKGVIRPRTDDFLSLRKRARDGVEASLRIELECRLNKLIALHFPLEGSNQLTRFREHRRASSFLDVLTGQNEIRAAEQQITPWEDDSSATQCSMCRALFHPLTNRKHHCRLCGKIVCALPIKHPQRASPCSILFIVDSVTRKVEHDQFGDGDTNIRRTVSKKPFQDEGKFLKGVRICRGCRPVLLRQQRMQEMSFSNLYQVLLDIEKEVEGSMPQFLEMIECLNDGEEPSEGFAAERKRLLDVLAQYEAIARQIRVLPCPPDGSQDRVQMAVVSRADDFVQTHMAPLQILPKSNVNRDGRVIDRDSEMSMALQLLLEQDALLESFVAKANSLEDATTLRANLAEIRGQVERILANTSGGVVYEKVERRDSS